MEWNEKTYRKSDELHAKIIEEQRKECSYTSMPQIKLFVFVAIYRVSLKKLEIRENIVHQKNSW